jgi:anti-sigma B factor antagonist
MRHSVKEERGSLIVSFAGEIDLEHSPQAREILLDQVGRRRRVLVDLSEVDYIDSSGIASLIEAFQKARKAGSGFALAAPNPAVMRVLQLARLDRVFRIFETVEAGLASAAEAPSTPR